MSRIICVGWAAVLTVGLIASDLAAQESRPIDFDGVIAGARGGPRGAAGPGRDFNEVTRGAEKVEGLFTLYKKGDHLYAEILPHQLNQPLLVPVTIARGIGHDRLPDRQDDEMVLIFRRVERPHPARPAEHPLQGHAGHAAGQVGQAELHRLGPDGPADRRR